jgi:hypothetical protein
MFTVKSQDFSAIYIPLPKQDLTIENYLQLIEQNTGYKLTYNSVIIDNKKIALNYDSLSVQELLDTLFFNVPVKYILKDNLLILSPQVEKASGNKQIKLRGTVLNLKSKKPISFAAVFVPNESTGTITNNEGVFEMYLPKSKVVDTIMISCLGYITEKIPTQKFLSGPIEVFLDPNKFILLSEVVVRPENPKELIQLAYTNKSQNYSNRPTLLTAFFREATKQNNKYISLSEALIDIYKTSYDNDNEDLVKLKKGRRGSNTEESELINLVVEGGLYNNMQLDIIKYGVSFLDPEQMYNYDYSMDKLITYDGRQTYIIKFRFKPDQPFVGFDGCVYLDVKSLAVVRSEFEISATGLLYAKEMMIKKTPPGFQVRPKFGKYEVEYRMYNDCWNLMHGRSEIGVKVKKNRGSKNKGYTCQFTSTSEFVVTGQETDGFERIKYREASKPKDILYQQISSTDLEFWANETIILPEEPLLETLEKLKLLDGKDKPKLVSTKPSEK